MTVSAGEGGECVALFRPRLLSNARQERHLCFVWNGHRIVTVYLKLPGPYPVAHIRLKYVKRAKRVPGFMARTNADQAPSASEKQSRKVSPLDDHGREADVASPRDDGEETDTALIHAATGPVSDPRLRLCTVLG